MGLTNKNQNLCPHQTRITFSGLLWDTLYINSHSSLTPASFFKRKLRTLPTLKEHQNFHTEERTFLLKNVHLLPNIFDVKGDMGLPEKINHRIKCFKCYIMSSSWRQNTNSEFPNYKSQRFCYHDALIFF